MMAALDLQAIASYSSMRIIDSLAGGFLVCLFAAVLLRFSRRFDAGTRFAIGFSALLAIALLPLSRGLAHGPSDTPTFVVSESWAMYVFKAWALVAALLLARVARSIWHLHKLRRACVNVDPASLDPRVAANWRKKQAWRKVVLCTSEQVRVPTALGLLKPAIVLPRWALEELSADELNQVVLHELAHLRRWDDWTNLAQQVVKALFFFHPAVWWIEKKIAFEREMACDDAVLAETASPRAYAECLAHLAERSFMQRGIALAQALIGRIAQTSQRIAKILDVNRPKADSRSWKPAFSVMVGAGVLCSVWAASTPELVGFENTKSGVEIASALPDRQMSVPATNASLVQRSTLERMAPKATPARLSRKSHQKNATRGPELAVQFEKNTNPMVHLSSAKTNSTPISETVFVFVQSGDRISADGQVYRIQMWRVMILPAPDAVGSKISNTKT